MLVAERLRPATPSTAPTSIARAHWRHHLVDKPRGWAPGERPGSVRYTDADLAAFEDEEGETPVLLDVGRFTEVKRVPLLIEAYARARQGFARPAPLVLVGGFPGEWEGEHPLEAVRRTGAQRRLPRRLARARRAARRSSTPRTWSCSPRCASSSARCSSRAMACGLPAIAVDAWGPADIVTHGETGWLVEPDDVVALANAIVDAVNARTSAAAAARARRRRARALRVAALAEDVAAVYDAARSDADGGLLARR